MLGPSSTTAVIISAANEQVGKDSPTTIRRPVREFGRPGGVTRRLFPQVQVLDLGGCCTYAVVAAQFCTLSVGDRELAGALLAWMEPRMLVITDRLITTIIDPDDATAIELAALTRTS